MRDDDRIAPDDEGWKVEPDGPADERGRAPVPDETTLEALLASPNCRRIITSGPAQVWMVSSPEQLAAFKRALKRD